VLHTVKGIDLPLAATALTAYMLGSTAGVLVGGWFADSFKRHILLFVTGLTALSALLIPRVNWLSLRDRSDRGGDTAGQPVLRRFSAGVGPR